MTDPQPGETLRQSIIDAIEAALQPLVEEGGVEIEPAGDPDIFPSFAIYDGGDAVIDREAGATRRSAQFTIEGYVERGDGKEPSGERNALHAKAVQAIMESDALAALTELVEDGDRRNATAILAEKRRMMFGQDFEIQFATERTNPALPA